MLNKHIGWAAGSCLHAKFHRISQTLQKEELNHAVCGDLYSLAVYLNDVREHFDRFEKTAKDMLPDVDYKGTTTRRRRKNKIMTVMQPMLRKS